MTSNPNQHPRTSESNARKGRAGHALARRLFEKLPGVPSLESRIDATKGPFVEVGAVPSSPRPRKTLIDLRKINKPLLTSNIYHPQVIESHYTHRISGGRKMITHRDEVPRSRMFKPIGVQFKEVESGPNWGEPILDDVDLIIDATDLPFDSGSVGALYANALHPEAEVTFVSDEAPRVLEPGGMLILDAVKPESIAADNPYLDTITLVTHGKGEGLSTNYAAVRNDVPYESPQMRQ